MNHLITIERRGNDTQDPESGEIIPNWEPFKENIFCDISALSAREYIQAKAVQSDISVRIKIPFIRDLEPENDIESNMRIIGVCRCHLGRIYNPKGILEDNITGQEYVTIPCSQGVNKG